MNDPVLRGNALALPVLVLALLGLPLAWMGRPALPFLGLKADPLSGGGGYEPASMELMLMLQEPSGNFTALRLGPERWKGIEGPALRSRILARALTAAPILESEKWDEILARKLNIPPGGGEDRLRAELGIYPEGASVSLSIKSLTPGRPATWLLEPVE